MLHLATVPVSSESLAAAVGLVSERADGLETLGQFLCFLEAPGEFAFVPMF